MIVPGQVPDIPEDGREYLATQFTIGDTNFHVGRFKAMHGWAVLESFRHAVSLTQNTVKLSNPQDKDPINPDLTFSEMVELVFKVFLTLETKYMDELRQCLFEITTFTNSAAKTRQSLLGAEDMAFAGLQPGSIYEVMSRAFVVNFSESLPIVQSVFQQMLTAILSNMIQKQLDEESAE